MTRPILSALLVLALAAPASAVWKPWKHRTHSATRNTYVRNTFGPKSIAGSAAGAGISTARDVPREWGRGGAGFGKRFASGFGEHIVNNSIRYSVASFRHEELGYHPSGKHGLALG